MLVLIFSRISAYAPCDVGSEGFCSVPAAAAEAEFSYDSPGRLPPDWVVGWEEDLVPVMH
jgi:hypothetical protein